jgi:hypothetical protein
MIQTQHSVVEENIGEHWSFQKKEAEVQQLAGFVSVLSSASETGSRVQ